MRKCNLFSFVVICCFIGLTACFGGGSSSSSSDGTTVSSSDLKSLSNLPDFDVDSYDQATNSSASGSLSKALMYAVENTNREKSGAGCAVRSMVDQFKFQMRDIQANICMMKKMNFSVAEDNTVYFSYVFKEEFLEEFEERVEETQFDDEDFAMEASASESGVVETSERARITHGDDKLTVDICSDESGTMKQIISIAASVDDGKFSIELVDHFNPLWDPSLDETMRVSVLAATDDPSKFIDGDTAFLGFQTLSPTWGSGDITLTLENIGGTLTNELSAAFKSGNGNNDHGTWTDRVIGKFKNDQGCSTHESSGFYPAGRVGDFFRDDFSQSELSKAGWSTDDLFCWKGDECESLADCIQDPNSSNLCEFSDGGTECFTYEVTEGDVISYVYDTSKALYYDEVLAMLLPTYADPVINMPSVWDCEIDGTATEIDPVSFGPETFAECFAIIEEGQDSDRDIESCFEQDKSGEAEDEFVGDMNSQCQNKVTLNMEETNVDAAMKDICSCLGYTGDKCTIAETTCADAYNVHECLEWLVGFSVHGEGQDNYLCPTLKWGDAYNAENLTKLCAADCYNMSETDCANTENTCTSFGAKIMGDCVDFLFGYYDEEQLKEENDQCSGVDWAKNVDSSSTQLTAFCTCFEIQTAECTPLTTTCKGLKPDDCLDKLNGF